MTSTPEWWPTTSYFIRHTAVLSVQHEDLDRIWEQDKIAVHYPGDGVGPDSTSLNPDHYEKDSEKRSIRFFKELADNGGYVWAETRYRPTAKVGIVKPQEPDFVSAVWTTSTDLRYQGKEGSEATLKALQMVKVREVPPGDAMSLRAARPPHTTISPWKICDPMLPVLIRRKPVDRIWSNLYPTLQEVACAEFLRHHENPRYPTIDFLLLPVGKTLADVDIYGVDGHGNKIFAQVTYHKKGTKASKKKEDILRNYRRPGNLLIYFCRCSEPAFEKDVLFVPVEEVLEWVLRNPSISDGLFSA
jgi:hypothetical protein